MQLIKRFGLVLMAVFALTAIAASTAAAEEKTLILPTPTEKEPLEVTSKGGEGTLLSVGGLEVRCKDASGSSRFTTANLGTFHVLFLGCVGRESNGLEAPCTGAGDEKEKILVLGKVHYVLALWMKSATETELLAALIILLEPVVKFTCEALFVKRTTEVKGCASSLATPINELVKETKDIFEEFKSGETKILEFLVEGTTGSETPCLTETSFAGKAFELSAEKGTAENSSFKKGGKEITIELMNPKK
jgi:hypothetical protein